MKSYIYNDYSIELIKKCLLSGQSLSIGKRKNINLGNTLRAISEIETSDVSRSEQGLNFDFFFFSFLKKTRTKKTLKYICLNILTNPNLLTSCIQDKNFLKSFEKYSSLSNLTICKILSKTFLNLVWSNMDQLSIQVIYQTFSENNKCYIFVFTSIYALQKYFTHDYYFEIFSLIIKEWIDVLNKIIEHNLSLKKQKFLNLFRENSLFYNILSTLLLT